MRYRHKVRVEYRVTTDDGQGGTTDTWTLLDVIDANVDADSDGGGETQTANETVSTVAYKVTARYRTGITAKMRLVYAGRVLRIHSVVNPGERNRELVMRCTERQGETP